MTTRTKAAPFSWGNVSLEDQAKVLDMFGDDGHSILSADSLRAEGEIPAIVLDTFTRIEKSDSSYKGSIYTESGRVEELRGIYCLSVIRSLAGYHGVTSHKFGRGSEARELTAGIRAKLAPEEAGA